jgi:hypothetical protein
MSRPTYVGPGSTPTFPWPAYTVFGRNSRQRAGLFQFWPIPAGTCRFWADAAQSRPTWAGTAEARRGPGRLPPGGPAPPSSRPAHPGLPVAAVPGCPGLHRGPTPLGRLGTSPLQLGPGWATILALHGIMLAGLGRAWPPRHFSLHWATPSSVSSAMGRVGTGLAGLAGRDRSLRRGN